jgi:hypothetical protein
MGIFTRDEPSIFEITKYCLPATLYLVVALVAVIFGAFSGFSVRYVFFSSALVVVWTVMLNWICSSGLAVLSWGLALGPFVVALIAFTFVPDLLPSIPYVDVGADVGADADVGDEDDE